MMVAQVRLHVRIEQGLQRLKRGHEVNCVEGISHTFGIKALVRQKIGGTGIEQMMEGRGRARARGRGGGSGGGGGGGGGACRRSLCKQLSRLQLNLVKFTLQLRKTRRHNMIGELL